MKKQTLLRESDLEEQAVAEFKRTTGPIFVLQSSTNIDRIVAMYRAARRSGRTFLQEFSNMTDGFSCVSVLSNLPASDYSHIRQRRCALF